MTDLLRLFCPCPDEDTALRIARALVEDRLVACANLHGPIRSVYRWQGAVEDAPEWQFEAKTRRAHLDAIRALIRHHHPYDLPAITWVTCEADPDTAAWIARETASGG